MRWTNDTDLPERINLFMDKFQDEIVQAFIVDHEDAYLEWLEEHAATTNSETEAAFAHGHIGYTDFEYSYAESAVLDGLDDNEVFNEED